MQQRILVVDDEKNIRKIVATYLTKEGFNVKTAEDGKEALIMVEKFKPDLLVLDLMLPIINGEEICRRIRVSSTLPIIMLTAKGSEEDKISGFNYGADDYLVKPFSPRELVARVKAILRRVENRKDKNQFIIKEGRLKIYPEKMLVKIDENEIYLTKTEFNILYYLVKNKGSVLSREKLAEKVMGLEFKGFDRTIDAHIKNIRQKLAFKKDEYIITVYGVGYKFIGDFDE